MHVGHMISTVQCIEVFELLCLSLGSNIDY